MPCSLSPAGPQLRQWWCLACSPGEVGAEMAAGSLMPWLPPTHDMDTTGVRLSLALWHSSHARPRLLACGTAFLARQCARASCEEGRIETVAVGRKWAKSSVQSSSCPALSLPPTPPPSHSPTTAHQRHTLYPPWLVLRTSESRWVAKLRGRREAGPTDASPCSTGFRNLLSQAMHLAGRPRGL